MALDRIIPYGEPVRANEIEGYGGREAALWLTDLGRLLIQAELAAEGLTYLVPQVTDRVTVRDGGVDASLQIILELAGPRTAGLVNAGRTIYQFKWRADRVDAIYAAKGELARLRDGAGLPDTYVFITNSDLGPAEKHAIRQNLQQGCPFREDGIVIFGAAELADRVNMDPRIRISHFRGATLGLCTWEKASEYAETRYGNATAPPFYNRDDEREQIQRFVGDPNARVLILHGPQAVGKTRVALQALSQVRDQVVWARDVPLQATSLVQVLDDAPRPTVLVLDVPEAPVDAIIQRALEAQHLKAIIVASESTRVPRVTVVAIAPFHEAAAMEFMKHALPRTPYGYAQWLYDQFAGFPGLLLQGATALASVGDRDPLEHDDIGAILDQYEHRVVAPVGAASETLTALSLLPRLALPRGIVSDDLRLLCDALGVDARRIRGDLELLLARHLMERVESPVHEMYRVTPPLLARRRAHRAIVTLADRLPDLITRLSPEGRAGLVRRVGESVRDPAIQATIAWLFTGAEIFASAATLADFAPCVAALTETAPERTATAVLDVLRSTDVETRTNAVAGDARRTLVRALEGLIHRDDTFEAAAESLLLLGEAENERYANNAKGVFNRAFNWRHPEIPRDARLRADLLNRLTTHATARQRAIIAQAAGEALETQFSVTLWQGESIALPELGWRARTWGAVQDAIRGVVGLLRALADDETPDVREAGRKGLARSVLGIAEVGIPEEGMSALEFLAGLELTPSVKTVVVDSIASLVSAIRSSLPQIPDADTRALREQLADRGDALFTRMTTEDFRARFHHWLGPAPMRPRRRLYGAGGWDEMRAEAERLAADVIARPELLTDDLLDWAIGDEASHAGLFLWHLGRLDRGRRWLRPLEARVPQMRVGGALATYLAAWAESDPATADEYLDGIVGRGDNWSYAAADAAWRLGPSSKNADRLLRSVTEGSVPRRYIAHQLSYGKWPNDLSLDDLLRLVSGLRDGTAEVDWALAEVLEVAWPERRGAWDHLGPLALEVLRNTAGTEPHQQDSHHWDALAAGLVQWNADVGFRLLLIHLENPEKRTPVFLRFDRVQLLQALSDVDRPRLVRELVTAASRGARALEIRLDLPHVLQPETDSGTLLQLADEAGLDVARLIAAHLDASDPGFLVAFETLGARWGSDDEVRRGLVFSAVMIRQPYSDKNAILERRLALMDELRSHDNARVADIAAEGRRRLLEEMRTA
jgi:hypothetical protein